jgi:hypothetical protein
MKNELTRFGPGKFLVVLILAAVPARAQTVNPAPAPAVQLPTYEVTESKNRKLEAPNPLFDHPFADLRSGPMIEAILWRHHYLEDHPREEAVILTTHDGGKIISATTVYTQEEKVYASSNALGEHLVIRGLGPADLHSADGKARALKFITGVRTSLGDVAYGINGSRPEDSNEAMNLIAVTPESVPALELMLTGGTFMDMPHQKGGSSDLYTSLNDQYAAVARTVSTGSPVLGALLVNAEETGDYRVLGQAAGAPTKVNVAQLRQAHIPEVLINQMIVQKLEANLRTRRIFIQPFSAPSDEVLTLTYRALRDTQRAGIVPVALASFGVKGAAVAIPPFMKAVKPTIHEQTCLILDWEGIQYYYQPDIGTWARPLPLNSITGQPYLCLKHGALMECAYFCATYTQKYPERKAQLVPGDPVIAAYQADDKLGIFIPTLGRFSLSKDFLEALGDANYLGQIRDKLVAMSKSQAASADVIPEEMPGDDGDLQMRRAFLAFKAAGIPCHLDESEQPSFTFTWDEIDYVYGPDQQVRPVAP